MKVLKFGGSSLGSSELIFKVKEIVEQQPSGSIVVVSAFKGVTDQLVKMVELATQRNDIYKNELEDVIQRHHKIIRDVIENKNHQETIITKINKLFDELGELLNGIFLLKDFTPKMMDQIFSYGELLSSIIVSEVIDNARFLDSRKMIKTDDNYGKANVDFEITNNTIQRHLEDRKDYYVVPGFIATDDKEETTTLGRGGSDYTAAIFAAALDAPVLEIWTDVDGFMTADPRMVDKAYAIESLSYSEAMELSHFGAKVIYTPTIKPVYQKNIPVVIKNTFNPVAKGTIISQKDVEKPKTYIKGVSSIENITLMTLQGAGLVGVTGIAMRLFGALAKRKVNIIMITQASSEHSISFAIAPYQTEVAKKAVEEEFIKEMDVRKDIWLNIEHDLSIIAIVGEEMKNTPGISANLFNSLGHNGVNVVAIAQGSSELNISVVVGKESLKKALNVIHEGFFLSTYKELHLFVVGTGNVGGELMNQLQQQQEKLLKEHKLKINLIGVADVDNMIIDEKGLDFKGFENKLKDKGEKTDLKKFVATIGELNLRNSVFVDVTASKVVAENYMDVFNAYASVVAANKIACSSEYKQFEALKNTAKSKGIRFLFETNVGAGLPIIKTLDDLINSGDKILKLEAVLSGTLNYIFNVLDADVPLSKAVKMAQEMGYSEPDPRVDLSGIDVIRKIMILSRVSGYKIEQDDVVVNNFLPKECFEGSLDDFWEKIKQYDNEFEENRKKLAADNKKWRFVAKLDNGVTSTELQSIDNSHPAYNLEGSNNIVIITTERYKELPLVIKGYGAGAAVTAAGIFADIIRVANV
jgi:aspartokinase/homoserine dehydrogenase 1